MKSNTNEFPYTEFVTLEDIDLDRLGNATYDFVTMTRTDGKNKVVVLWEDTWLILGNGSLVKIDQDDIDAVQKHRWWRAGKGYVGTDINGHNLYLHRYLINPNEDELVDHIDGDKHNNTRENLRVASHQLNCWNRVNSSSKTGFVGISMTRRNKRYFAYLYHENEAVLSKNFYYLTDARIARLEAELKYRGKHTPGLLEELQWLIDHREELIDSENSERVESQIELTI